ncbi:MAG: site-specific integrase [Terriglobia bacterium]
MTSLRRRMIDDLTLRNRAPRTIQAYTEGVADFTQYFDASPEKLGPEQVRSYLLHLVQERHVSWSYYNQIRCALQFLYRVTLGKDWVVEEVASPRCPSDSLSSSVPTSWSGSSRKADNVSGTNGTSLALTRFPILGCDSWIL